MFEYDFLAAVLDPATAMFLASIAANSAKQIPKVFQKKFGSTKMGKYYKGVQAHGNLTPGQETQVLSDTSKVASGQAALVNKNYQGQAINQGTEGSVAHQRSKADAERSVRGKVGDTAASMYYNEEMAKKAATQKLAEGEDATERERTAAKWSWATGGLTNDNSNDLVKSGVNAYSNNQVNNSIAAFQGSQQTEADVQNLYMALVKQVGHEEALKMLSILGGKV